MAIIVGRRDNSPLISSAGPVAVPDKTPTQEFAQGISAAATTYALGRQAVIDTSNIATIGAKIGQGDPGEKRQEYLRKLKEAEERHEKLLFGDYNKAQLSMELDQSGMEVELKKLDYMKKMEAGDIEGARAVGFDAKSYYGDVAEPPAQAPAKAPAQAKAPAEAQTRTTSIDLPRVEIGRDSKGRAVVSSKPLDTFNVSTPVYTAKTWAELRDKTMGRKPAATKKISDADISARIRAMAKQRAREEVGARPVSLAEIRTRAMIAATTTDFKLRAEMVRDIMDDYDRSGGEGVPINNWWDLFTGEHVALYRKEVEKMVSITPETAEKIRAYQAQQIMAGVKAKQARQSARTSKAREEKTVVETSIKKLELADKPHAIAREKAKAKIDEANDLLKYALGTMDYKQRQVVNKYSAEYWEARIASLKASAGRSRASRRHLLSLATNNRDVARIEKEMRTATNEYNKAMNYINNHNKEKVGGTLARVEFGSDGKAAVPGATILAKMNKQKAAKLRSRIDIVNTHKANMDQLGKAHDRAVKRGGDLAGQYIKSEQKTGKTEGDAVPTTPRDAAPAAAGNKKTTTIGGRTFGGKPDDQK